MDIEQLIRGLYPYADQYGVLKTMPDEPIDREEVLRQIESISDHENQNWQHGQCSGTMYCGDMEHYAFLNQVFGHYSHVNTLQRDICLSINRFESEIIAMTLDMLHGSEVKNHHPSEKACGAVTSGGSESIMNAMLVYRNKAKAERGVERPNLIMPETAHAAFVKAGHLFEIEVRLAPIDPVTTLADVDWIADNIDENTVTLVGSAGNYPYGTVDPIDQLSELALRHNIGLHIDGCLGGFILPWGERLGFDVPVFDFRLPGVTSISADTHKYGYGLKGCSTVLYRDKSFRQHQYFVWPTWQGGTYASPGLLGSRSGGLVASTWAAMVTTGKQGYLEHARKIFDTSYQMQNAVTSHSELRLMGKPTWCFSFTSDQFNIYHLNDFMVEKGWRFNGQQRPDAIHMCVTRPQTQPGIVAKFANDLSDAVQYAKSPHNGSPKSGGIYGGGAMGIDTSNPEFVRMFLHGAMDVMAEYPF